MFASAALARRIEGAEASLTHSVASAVRERHPERRVLVARLGGGAAAFAGGSPFDKAIGLGFAPLLEQEFAASSGRSTRAAPLVLAAEDGCDLAVVTTEPASVSQANVMRAAFSLLYSRAILVKDAG